VTFSGGDFVPSVDGKNVRIIYVGSVRSTSGSSALIEMAPTSRDSEGTRRAAGFRDHRINASVERVNDNVVELTSPQSVSPGSYAVGVNDEYFELNVE
jgi:hypothetical protein